MPVSIEDIRAAGLEARLGKWRGRPAIFLRDPKALSDHQRSRWWLMDSSMVKRAEEVGIVQAYDEHTLLGNLFSVGE